MRPHITSALWSIGAAGLWFALASNNPTQTYHFAPLIVAGAWPTVLERRDARSLGIAATGALAIALVTTALLSVGDSLRGPDLVDGHAATVESIIFALLGAVLAVGMKSFRGFSAKPSPRTRH